MGRLDLPAPSSSSTSAPSTGSTSGSSSTTTHWQPLPWCSMCLLLPFPRRHCSDAMDNPKFLEQDSCLTLCSHKVDSTYKTEPPCGVRGDSSSTPMPSALRVRWT